jgi:hypothetical protein
MCYVQDIVWECVAVVMWRVCDSQVEIGNEAVTSAGANVLLCGTWILPCCVTCSRDCKWYESPTEVSEVHQFDWCILIQFFCHFMCLVTQLASPLQITAWLFWLFAVLQDGIWITGVGHIPTGAEAPSCCVATGHWETSLY